MAAYTFDKIAFDMNEKVGARTIGNEVDSTPDAYDSIVGHTVPKTN